MRQVAGFARRSVNVLANQAVADRRSMVAGRGRLAVGLWLAGTALAPLHAQTLDLAGVNQSLPSFAGFNVVTNTVGTATATIDGTLASTSYGAELRDGVGGVLALAKSGAGTLIIARNAANPFSGGITLSGGLLQFANNDGLGTGTITVTGAASLSPTGSDRILSNAIVLNADLNTSGNWAIAGQLSGAGTLSHTAAGVVNLTNAGNGGFSGNIVINGGGFGFVTGSAGTGAIQTGNTATIIRAAADANVVLDNNITIGSQPGATETTQINFTTPASAGNALVLNGVVSGPGRIYLRAGEGTLLLNNAANNYGTGVLEPVNLASSGYFGVGANGALVGNIGAVGVGNVAATWGIAAHAANLVLTNNALSFGTMRFDTRGFDSAYNGVLSDRNGAQVANFQKLGDGTLSFGGTHLYTGTTTVTAGRLDVTGSIGAGGTSVAAGATLAGSGNIAGLTTVGAGATLTAGTATMVGTLTLADLTADAGSTLFVRIGEAGVPGGVNNDLINVTGTATVNGTVNIGTAPGRGLREDSYFVLTAGTLLGMPVMGVGPAGFVVTLDTVSSPNTILANVSYNGVRAWDGAGPAANGVIDGGAGTWDDAALNFTDIASGTGELAWVAGSDASFGGTGGAVTVAGVKSVGDVAFAVDGYTLSGDALTLNGGTTLATASVFDVAAGATATVGNDINAAAGIALDKRGDGILVLGGTVTAVEATAVRGGTLQIDGTHTGDVGVRVGATVSGAGSVTGALAIAAGGGTISPGVAGGVGTLTAGQLVLNDGMLAFDVTPGGASDLINVTGGVTLSASPTFNLNLLAAASPSVTTLITYGGSLSPGANSFQIGSPIAGGFAQSINTNTNGQVNLIIDSTTVLHWDGAGPAGNDVVDGGAGTWTNDPATTNWTNANGMLTTGWAGTSAVFGGATGTVTVDNTLGDVAFEDLTFNSSYTLSGDRLTALGIFATNYSEITVAAAQTVTVNNDINANGAASFDKYGDGTLVLNGAITMNDTHVIHAGTTVLNGTFNNTVVVETAGTIAGNGSAAGLTLTNGATLSPGTGALDYQTLSIAGNAAFGASSLAFELLSPGLAGTYDRLAITGNLTLSSNPTFSLTGAGTSIVGDYSLITYGGTFTSNGNNFLTSAAPLGVLYTVDTATAGAIIVNVSLTGGDLYWDGTGALNNAVDGGSGTWNSGPGANTNWSNITGAVNAPWAVGSNAVFGVSGGTVTVDGPQIVGDMTFDAGGYTLTGAGITSNTGNIILNADPMTGGTTIANVISGTNGLTTSGVGVLALNGANDFTGAVSLGSTGEVRIGNSAAFGAAANVVTLAGTDRLVAVADGLDIANDIALAGFARTIDTNGFVATVSGDFSGGALNKAGAGTLTLTGTNNFIDFTNVLAGTLAVGSAGALGNQTVILEAGTTLQAAAALTFANDVGLAGAATIDTNGFDLRLDGIVTDGGNALALTKAGAGTLTLTGANTYGGGTNINAGTVAIDDAAAIGSGAIALADGTTLRAGLVDGQTITLANALSVAGAATINNGLATDTFNDGQVSISGTTLAIDGAVTGAGTLGLSGGATRLADTSGFTGNISLANGALLDLVDASSLGNGALLSSGSNSIRNNSGAALSFGNTVTATGGFFVVNGADDVALTGAVAAQDLAKVGPATLTLANGGNAFTSVQLYSGTIAVGANGALGNASVSTGAGTLLAAADNLSFGNAFNIGLFGGDLAVDTQAFTLTLSGAKEGAAGLIKTGTGTLILGGANSYVGLTSVNQGTLDLQGTIANNVDVAADGRLIGAGSVAGTVTFADGADVNPGNSPGTLTFGNLVLGNATNLNFELAGVAGVPGVDADLINVTNNLTLDGVLNITGLPGFNVGVGNRTIITYGNLVANGDVTIATPAPVDVSYTVLAGPVASGAGIVQLNVAFTGIYRWDGANIVPNNVIDGGDGVFNLANTNFTNSDGSFNLAYGNNATDDIEFGGAVGNVDVAEAINFDQMTFVTTGYTLGGAGSLNANNSVINVGALSATINTNITGGALAKNGAGTLTLAGNNGNASLAVSAGTLVAASDTALGVGTATFAGGTTLVSSGTPRSLGNAIVINAAGGLTIDAATTTLALNGAISGTGPLALTSSGGAIGGRDGIITLAGLNGYTGGTTITGTFAVINADSGLGDAAGNVALDNAELRTTATTTSARAFALNGAVANTINTDAGAVFTVNGVVSGTSQLQKIGDGTLVLGNAGNSYQGGTDINAGTVSIASNGALGALGGNVSFTGTSTLQTTANVTSARLVSIAGGVIGTVETLNANDTRLDGVISGDGTLAKTGDGRLTLTGTNGYTGGTNLNAGTLRIDDGNAIGTGTLTTQNGTTFTAGLAPGAGTITLAAANNVVLTGGQTTIDLVGTTFAVNGVTGAVTSNGTNLVINGVISGDGGFTTNVATTGQIVLNGNNSFTGDVTLNNAVAFVGNDNALGVNNTVNLNAFGGIRNAAGGTTRTLANNVVVNDPNATLGGNGNIVVNGVVSGSDPAVLNKVGLGTVTLANAANSIAAQIEVAQGELAITGALTNAAQLTNVRAGATLSGTGSIAGTVEVVNSGVLSAGIGGNGSVGALSIGRLLLNEQSSLVFDLGAANVQGGALNDQINVGSLRLGGRLTVREATGGSFGLGIYNLITYQGALEAGSNSVFVQTLPGAFSGVVQTVIPGEVNLVVTNPGTLLLSWDGADNTGGTNGAQGGTGTWSAAGTNWTGEDPAELNTTWFNSSVATFRGAAGTVTLDGTFNAAGFQFTTDGYTLQQGLIDNQSSGVGTGMFIATSPGVTATINSRLQGDGITFKQGAGTLVLGGNNTGLSGDVQVQAGTLALTANRGAGTGTIALSGNTTLAAGISGLTVANAITTAGVGTIDSGNGSLTLSGVVSGPGSIVKTNSGTLTLTGTNSYVGGTALNGGTVVVSRDANLGDANGAVTFDGGSLVFDNGATAVDSVRNFVANTNASIATIGTAAVTLNGIISGNSALVKGGAGTLVLTGSNSYNGTVLLDGVLSVGSDANLGAATGVVRFQAPSVLRTTNAATLTSDRLVILDTNGTIDTVGAAPVVLNGAVIGAGRLIKTGAGTLTLNAANFYAGGTALNAGTIVVGNDLALSGAALDMAGGTTLAAGISGLTIANAITTAGVGTIDSGMGVFTLGGVVSGAGSLTKVGTGNLVLGNANTYTGGTALNAGTITVGTSTALGVDAAPGSSRLTMAGGTTLAAGVSGLTLANVITTNGVGTIDSGTGIFTLNGVISGNGSLTKVNSGNLVLNGVNDFTGGSNLNAGTTTVGTNAALGQGPVTLAGGATLAAGVAGLNVGNAIETTGAGIVDTRDFNFTLSGVISGAGSIDKNGGGTLLLTNANSYSGGTNLNFGRISVFNDLALGTGVLAIGNNTILNAGVTGLTLANNIVLAAPQGGVGTVNVDTGLIMTLNGNISSPTNRRLRKDGGGELVLNGVSSTTGGTFLIAGTVTAGNNRALGTPGSRLEMNNNTTLAAGVDGLNLDNNVGLAGIGIVDTRGFTLTLSGPVDGVGNLTKVNAGNLILTGNNSYSGGTALNAGTITVRTNTALGTNTLAMADGTTLAAGVSGLVVANNITTAGVGTIDSGTGVFTLNGVISGPGGLTKINTGNLVLNGANDYVGGTNVAAGTVTVGNNTAFGSGLVTMADGTVLANNVSGLVIANNFSIGNVEVATGGSLFTMSGQIGGAGLLTKTGTGRLVLTGDNSYAGGTALTAGSLVIGSNTALGTGTLTTTGGVGVLAGVNDPSGATLTLANNVVLGVGTTNLDLQGTEFLIFGSGDASFNGTNLTLNGMVSGDGALSVFDNGRLNLNGANSYAGGTTVNNAAIFVGTDSALGTGIVTSDSMVLGNDSGALRTLANAFVLNSSMAVGGLNDITLNGVISGGAGIIKGFNTTLTLNGDNSYSGVTEQFGGRITVGTNTAMGTSTLRVFNALGQTTTLAAGIDGLALANTIELFGSNLIVESGAGMFTLNGVISNTGALTKVNSGNLVLNGANSFMGGTALNAGTITVGNDTALGTNTLAMADGTTLAAGITGLAIANAITTAGVGTIDSGTGIFTLNGVISGAGSLAKVNSGTLILNGNSDFAGGTALNAGTIQVGSNTALGAGTLAMADGTTLVAGVSGLNVGNAITLAGLDTIDPGTGIFTLSGVISGGGTLNKVNTGNLVLTGNNAFTGGTNLTAGTLTVTNNNSIGTGTLTTTGGTTLTAGTVTGANAAITLANGIVLGAGATSVDLQGTTLMFNNDASIVTDGASLTLNGVVSGDGTLATGNFGTLTLNGANSYSGGTLINTRSVVYIGSDTAVGSGSVTMGGATGLFNFSGATRTLANSFVLNGGSWLGGGNDLLLNGTISGAGFVIKGGAQTLVLNGANDFTGTSQLRDGRITVGTNTALGLGALRVFAPTVAPVAGLATTLTAGTTGLTLANNVTLDIGSNLIVESGDGVFTLNGVISGDGAVTKVNSGNLVINAANTFTGGTALNVGTITVGSNTALGTGMLVIGDDATLRAGVSGLTLANAIATSGHGIIDTGAGIFTLNGVVSSTGTLNKINSGTLVLNGANTFSGGMRINAGTLVVGTNTAAGTGILTIFDGATLTPGVSGLSLANAVITTGIGTIDTGTGSFTLNGPISGAGSLVKGNTGTLVLNGDNSYAGGTALSAGTIRVGSNTALGTGTLAMAGGTTLTVGTSGLVLANAITTAGVGIIDSGPVPSLLTLNGVISGAGSLTKIGTGLVALNGANSYTGGTALDVGTIIVGSNTALGTGALAMADNTLLAAGVSGLTLANAISTAGGGTIDSGTGVFTLNGVISSSGTITKINTGNLVLNGASTFSGGTRLNAGTLTVGSNTAAGTGVLALADGTTLSAGVTGLTLANAITTAGIGTIDSGTGTFTLNGAVSGAGSLNKVNTGNLVLNGANTFTGGTNVASGTLTVGSNTAAGTGTITLNTNTTLAPGATGISLANAIAMAGNATVTSGTGNFTLSGAIGGAGNLTKTGTGTLNVSGVGTLTGATIVNAGTLNLTGSLAGSAFTVQTGATLTGTGTTGALNVQAGSFVTPGGTAVGTLNVNGAAVLAGTYRADITPTGGNDRITATGALTVGGNLAVTPTGTFNTFFQTFTLASGSTRTGTFTNAALGNFGAPFVPVLDYTATSVNLRLTPASLVNLGGTGLFGNALTVAQTFDRAVGQGFNPQAFFNLYTQGSNIPSALTELGGELHAAERRVVLEDTRVVREAAFDRLNSGLAAVASGQSQTVDSNGRAISFWVRGAGSWGSARPDANGQRFSTEQTGVLGGVDVAMGDFKIGGMFNYTNNDVRFDRIGTSRVRSTGGAIYAGWRQPGKGFAVGGGVALADLDVAGSRTIAAPGLGQTLRANYGGTSWQIFGEVAYDLSASDTVRIEPFARFAYTNGRTGAFSETGGVAQVAALGENRYLNVFDAGIRGGVAMDNFEVLGSLAWHGVYGSGRDGRVDLTLDSLPTTMRIRSVGLDRSAAAVELQARYNISSRINLGVGYSGIYGDRNTDHGARATLTVGF